MAAAPKDLLVIAYGVALAVGGSIGYLKRGSVISVFAGSVTGGLMILSGMDIVNWKTLATVVSAFMTLLMTTRYMEGKKFMPPGLVALLSAMITAKLLIL